MTKRVLIIAASLISLLLISCEKQPDEPTVFDLYGKWGVSTVTYTWPDRPAVYMEDRPGHYYEYWTFQVNGVVMQTFEGLGETKYGDFIYYKEQKKVSYVFDGNKRRITASIVEHSPTSMTFIADLQEVGETIYTMKKVAW